MKVEDIMTRDVRSCAPEESLSSAAQIMWEVDCGAVPVVNAERRVRMSSCTACSAFRR